jgi:hypothetical protein
MDPNFRVGQEFRIEHRHSDGSWSPLAPIHHGEAEHDAERSWIRRRIFRCACGEEIAVTEGAPEDDDPPRRD